MKTISQLDGNFDFNYMCMIIFIAKIPLQFQIKLQGSVTGLCPGSTGDLGSLQGPYA